MGKVTSWTAYATDQWRFLSIVQWWWKGCWTLNFVEPWLLLKSNLVLFLIKEQLMQCLCCKSRKKSIILKKKLWMFFVDMENAFYRLPRKLLEWTIWKKWIPDVLVRSVMILYEGAKARVRVDSELLEEIDVDEGMHQGSVLSLFLFAVVVDVVTELARGVLSGLLYADDFVKMNGTIKGLEGSVLEQMFKSVPCKNQSDGQWRHCKEWLF